MTTANKTNVSFKIGDRVRWIDGKRPRMFRSDVRGTVVTPPRQMSGETIYVEWDGFDTIPVSQKAVELA